MIGEEEMTYEITDDEYNELKNIATTGRMIDLLNIFYHRKNGGSDASIKKFKHLYNITHKGNLREE